MLWIVVVFLALGVLIVLSLELLVANPQWFGGN
jgi:hypothetical protein